MSEEDSPKRMPVRVHSIFEIAEPITELPPDRDAAPMSPATVQKKMSIVDELLANAPCEEGASMADIATYIPSKAVRKQMEEAAQAAAVEQAAAKAARIAALEEELAALKSESPEKEMGTSIELEKLSITRPTSVIAHGIALTSSASAAVASGVGSVQSPVSPHSAVSSTRGSLSSNNAVFVAPPAIGALVAAPPAMGALMAAPPAIGALVAAVLQPAASADSGGEEHFGDDFQLIHNEYKQALSMDKSVKKHR